MASPKKESTMEQTIKEGKQFLGEETKETPEPKKAGTMETTAKEGIDYLKREHHDHLLKAQGLVTDETEDKVENGSSSNGAAKHDTPSPAKQATMAATKKEGEALLDSLGSRPDPDVKTRGQQKELDEASSQVDSTTTTPKREGTILKTTKAAQ